MFVSVACCGCWGTLPDPADALALGSVLDEVAGSQLPSSLSSARFTARIDGPRQRLMSLTSLSCRLRVAERFSHVHWNASSDLVGTISHSSAPGRFSVDGELENCEFACSRMLLNTSQNSGVCACALCEKRITNPAIKQWVRCIGPSRGSSPELVNNIRALEKLAFLSGVPTTSEPVVRLP
jgi:hypothetical protein